MPTSIWTYNDWASQSGTVARIARLRLHIDEVSGQIGKEISGDGKSVSTQALQSYLDSLMKRLDTLEARPDATGARAGGVSFVNFGKDPG